MRLVKRNPREFRARIGIASILNKIATNEKQRNDAVEHLLEVLEMQPENFEAKIQLGFIFASNSHKEYEKAANYLYQGLRLV